MTLLKRHGETGIVIARCLDCRRLLIERRPWRDDEGRVLCDRCVGLRPRKQSR